jgi:hypothetical protein
MIMPALPKRFHFATSFGKEWRGFWNGLWQRAKQAIEIADELVVIGYSLPKEDKRARKLLLGPANKAVRVTICCGSDTGRLEQRFRKRGFSDTKQIGGDNKFQNFLERSMAEDGAGERALMSYEYANRTGRSLPDLQDLDTLEEPDEEPEAIKRESIERQVYIFNAGPFLYDRPGSMGTFRIPALKVSDCLTPDLLVADPLVIPGRPSEYYYLGRIRRTTGHLMAPRPASISRSS